MKQYIQVQFYWFHVLSGLVSPLAHYNTPVAFTNILFIRCHTQNMNKINRLLPSPPKGPIIATKISKFENKSLDTRIIIFQYQKQYEKQSVPNGCSLFLFSKRVSPIKK